ncbi:spore-associated protein A [Streptomyces sp. NPDC088725]|uniref:spore-associated protein A n=1 Tax=Streptomyces sp. NPDC088725 TaxID=3365873 RepID=UPI0037F24826
MKLIQRGVVSGILAAGLVGGTALVAPQAGASAPAGASPARAVATQATYGGECGPGYTVVNSAEVGKLGTVFLTYDRVTGNNCVVTLRTRTGTRVWMVASLRVAGSGQGVSDSGYYTKYAGPVSAKAAGKCVSWYGVIGSERGGKDNTNCGTLSQDQSS